MKTKAAVLWGINQKWEVEEVDLDGPKEDEVLVKMTASGLCHSDYHLVTGDLPAPLPLVGGHEGAGVVVEVGPGVKEVAEGDHVVMSFLPACGRSMSNLCDLGACRDHRRGRRPLRGSGAGAGRQAGSRHDHCDRGRRHHGVLRECSQAVPRLRRDTRRRVGRRCDSAPAILAPWIALTPTPPMPITTTVSPGYTSPVRTALPYPVVTPQRRRTNPNPRFDASSTI